MKLLKRKMFTAFMAILLALSIPLSVLAGEYDLTVGDITINADDSGQYVTQEAAGVTNQLDAAPVITSGGQETANVVTVNADAGADASVTIQDVNINTYADNHNYDAAITVNSSEGSTVTVTVEGTNTLIGENGHAALQTNGDGSLVINGEGSLTATGGPGGAGIGGGCGPDGQYGSGSNITIESGNITANGGYSAAGIGGASQGVGTTSNIQINGGTVVANGGECGAGIGGGYGMDASNITIRGGTVTATGGVNTDYYPDEDYSGYAAGIGGGLYGQGTDIEISGGTVTATGGIYAAGIGGGYEAAGSDIAISGGNVTVSGGDYGAGIGGGAYGKGSGISITGGTVNVTNGYCGAGIGGGYDGTGSDVTVSGSANVTVTVDEYSNVVGGGYEQEAIEPDLSGLYTTGSFNGVSGEVKDPSVVEPESEPQPEPETTPIQPAVKNPEPDEQPEIPEDASYSMGSVVDAEGNAVAEIFSIDTKWEETVEADVLTIVPEKNTATMSIQVSNIQILMDCGIKTIVFVVDGEEMELDLSDILVDLKPDDVLQIKRINGKLVILVNGKEVKL